MGHILGLLGFINHITVHLSKTCMVLLEAGMSMYLLLVSQNQVAKNCVSSAVQNELLTPRRNHLEPLFLLCENFLILTTNEIIQVIEIQYN